MTRKKKMIICQYVNKLEYVGECLFSMQQAIVDAMIYSPNDNETYIHAIEVMGNIIDKQNDTIKEIEKELYDS